MSSTVGLLDLSSKYIALAIVTAVFGVIAGFLLNYTRRIRRMPTYFKANFSICKTNPKIAIVATILYYLLLAVPIILLIIWLALLGSDTGSAPALPILFTALFLISLVIPTSSKYFYLKVLASFVLFITSQLITMSLFWSNTSSSAFFCLTAILLSINGVFVAVTLWLFDGTSWNLANGISKGLKDKVRQEIQIWKQQASPPQIITGGLYYYISVRPTLKIILVIVFYLLSLLTLMTYSLVGYYHTDQGNLALINSICVISTDIILVMIIFITKDANFNPITNSVAAMAVRACLIGFTGNYWFLGYCFLYLILGFYLSILVINRFYPPFEKLPSLTIEKKNIFTMPEFPMLFLQGAFGACIYYIIQDNGRHLKTVSFNLDGTIYNFWAIGIAFYLLQFSLFFYLISYRIVLRSKNRIRSINFYYMGCQWCSEYYFFLFFGYGFLVILGFYMYNNSGSILIWNSCVFLPLFLQALILFLDNWTENDFLLLGSVDSFNKKVAKRKQRMERISKLKTSVIKNLKVEGMSQLKMKEAPEGQQGEHGESSKINLMEGAQIQSNFMVENDSKAKTYEEWNKTYGLIQAFRQDKMLPTDKKIIFSLLIMILSLAGYCLVFTISQKNATVVTISVELLFLFLTIIPMKRYFSTLQRPGIGQIILFALGIVINYVYGILSYVLKWNDTTLWSIWWLVINVFILALYSTISLLRDKGLVLISYISCAVSVVLLALAGALLIGVFDEVQVGIVLITVSLYYGYCLGLYIIYLHKNKSMPIFMNYITLAIIIVTTFAVMIYGFVSPSFDNFYGFTITYLVINFLILVYGAYLIVLDQNDRFQRPNFYSPYGSPVFKYDPNIRSVSSNEKPLLMWIGGWLMFYGYTILMEIFISDTNYGISASSIFFVVIFLTFVYFTTYNVYKAGTIRQDITAKIAQDSWTQVLEILKATGATDIDIDTLSKQLQGYQKQLQSGIQSRPVQIKPQQKQSKIPKPPIDLQMTVHDLQQKLQKAVQNEKIMLINLWIRIIFKCQTLRKQKMMKFTNFIKQDGQLLSEFGVAIVLDGELYDIESVYNQARQQYNMLSPMQKIQFDKKFKEYLERKQKHQQANQDLNKKAQQSQNKREDDLRKKLDSNNQDDTNLPIQKMKDSPQKNNKMLQTLKQPYIDVSFEASSKNIPDTAKSQCKQWVRPPLDSKLLDVDAAMSVKQGYIGDCYLISAIGVLDDKSLKKILGIDQWKNAQGSFMVKFNKYGKDVYIIIDSRFPSAGGTNWLFGRCQNEKQIFTNIIQKAYAKLYGGYQNIVGGKVNFALADMTGGFPEQIKLKTYQESKMDQLFSMMIQFKKSGYLMGAGSPENAKGDTVEVDGIVQGHAYLILDVRDLDGNKLLKIRNPHGAGGRQSTLDWSDNSSKWTKRLLNLVGQEMKDDGAFWMSIEDFVFCFRALYVCRIFDQRKWRKLGPITGEWRGSTAAGLPTKKNPTATIALNPHYGIKVNKKSTLFVQLTQNQKDQQRRGKNYIFFMVQKNDGKRISSQAVNKLCGTSGSPINSSGVSGQIVLDAPSFPYTFSLMVSAYEKDAEGTFSLNLYCDDMSMQVVDQSAFDK